MQLVKHKNTFFFFLTLYLLNLVVMLHTEVPRSNIHVQSIGNTMTTAVTVNGVFRG